MYYNPNVFVTLFLAGILWFIGFKFSKTPLGSKHGLFTGLLLFILCIPGFLIVFANILPFKDTVFFKEYRSIEFIEVSASLIPAFCGYILGLKPLSSKVRWKIYSKYIYILCFVMVLSPFVSSIIFPVEFMYKLSDNWCGDICLQTSEVTCAPASLASVFKYYGIEQTEKDIAKAVYTSLLGTEDYYIVRYARKNGFKVNMYNNMEAKHIPVPSIITVKVQNIWHSVAVLGKKGGYLIIGDPLIGRVAYSFDEIVDEYEFGGEVYHFIRE